MDEKTNKPLKKEMWEWIGSLFSIGCWIVSFLIKKENHIDTSNVPSFINEWLIEYGYAVIKISDVGYNSLLDTACFCSAGLLFYFISIYSIQSGGVVCFKSFCRGAFLWGGIATIILIKCFGLDV
jgi:hypothetical protein